MLNRVMTRDNIGLCAMLKCKSGLYNEPCVFLLLFMSYVNNLSGGVKAVLIYLF